MKALHAEPANGSSPSLSRALYRVTEVMELLSLGRTKVYELIRCGRLTSAKIGRATRVTGQSLRSFVSEVEANAEATV